MPLPRVTRQFASWIAILAVLMSALAPAVSHGLGTRGVAAWVQVCTAQGTTSGRSDAAPGDDSAPGVEHAFEHCPYCSVHPDAAGIPPAHLHALPPAGLAQAVPHAFLAAPRTLHAWVSAQPRAPPPAS